MWEATHALHQRIRLEALAQLHESKRLTGGQGLRVKGAVDESNLVDRGIDEDYENVRQAAAQQLAASASALERV